MDNKDYLDFDEAVEFLKTTPSTLYKWLQGGKIPGHKLGRQWRFLREELELHVSGKAPKIQLQKEILKFAEFLENRSKQKSKEGLMNAQNELSEKLIWDAYDHGIREIHVSPTEGQYQIAYRSFKTKSCEQQTKISESLLNIIDQSWNDQSASLNSETSRRMYLHRGDQDSLQVRYQKVKTIAGSHITLMLLQPHKDVMTLDKLGFSLEETQKLRTWMDAPRGVILVSGETGSGKTTTVYSLLHELKLQQKVIFTLEAPAMLVVDGVNQVEHAPRNKEQFEQNFLSVCATNPDVIALGLGSTFGLEENIAKAAFQAASDGTLVILQVDASSPQTAISQVEKQMGASLGKLLIGACWQKLVPRDDKGWKAQYEFTV
jgi:excisionase family DNA binding protein